MKWHRILSVAAIALAGGLAPAQGTPGNPAPKPVEEKKWELEDKCSFYLDFDGTLEANFAEGDTKPQGAQIEVDGQRKYLASGLAPVNDAFKDCFVPGPRGKALSTKNGKTTLLVLYPAAKNLNSRHGTVAFWMKYDAVVNGPAENGCFNAPGFMYINMSREGQNGKAAETTHIWFAAPPGVPSSFGHNGWMILSRNEPWKPGEWHYATLTWDLQEIRYYEDGALLGKQTWETGRPMNEGMGGPFVVSLAEFGGKKHDTVVMAEFCIFSIALTDELVRQEYERLRPGAAKPGRGR